MNIDTSTIEGFDSMSAEDKVSALLSLNIPDAVDPSKYVSKAVFDKKASEAAELSKQLKGKMSEDELAEAERKRLQEESDQKYADLESKYNELVKKSTIADYKSQYISQGMDAKLAEETAKALADWDMPKVFANQLKHQEAMRAKIMEELMNGMGKPGGTGGDDEDKPDQAVELAKKLAKSRLGDSKAYEDVMNNYK